jgi:AcrR family transcriptional regulator
MQTAAGKAPAATGTRQRLIDVAVCLFTRHSVAGTSLQMIADELGFTKAAVYHHFRTRDELLNAVVEPVFAQLGAAIENAEAQRSQHARAEAMLCGFVTLVVQNRALMGALAGDPGMIDMVRTQTHKSDLIRRQFDLLAGLEPGPNGLIKASMALAGMAGAARPVISDMGDDALARLLAEAGRRILGLRQPRSAPVAPKPAAQA